MRKSRWTDLQLLHLHDLYSDHPTADVARFIGRSTTSTYQVAQRYGLAKSDEYLDGPASGRLLHGDTRGASSRFKKGHVTWNSGMKGWKAGGRAPLTQFKPGMMPHNHSPVGTVVLATDGYLKIKVAEPKQWKWLHRYVWEKMNGPIPTGVCITFKDGNSQNCDPGNLKAKSRTEVLEGNSRERYPKEVLAVIKLATRLKRKIDERVNR